MPNSIVLYHLFESLEWGTRYYGPFIVDNAPTRAAALAAAEAPLVTTAVQFNRWELLGPTGTKLSEGSLTATFGGDGGDMMPIHYALLVRLVSPALGRPSTKYIHGYTEDINGSGALNGTGNTRMNSYGTALILDEVMDSDGQTISGVVFRSFTRRKRMRQVIQ